MLVPWKVKMPLPKHLGGIYFHLNITKIAYINVIMDNSIVTSNIHNK